MKPETIRVIVDGRTIDAAAGTTIASVLLNEGIFTFRRSETGEPRTAVCGMGVCYECRVKIDGVDHQRACMTLARDGMHVETAESAR